MTDRRLRSEPLVDLDIEWAFLWYENEREGLGHEFLEEVRAAYNRIIAWPLGHHHLQAGIRRGLLRRFPYAVYFVVDDDDVVILAVLHTSRDPATWQRRRPDAAQ